MKGELYVLQYPQKYMISSGTGKSAHELVSFDNALISAKISNYNLLRVSSILPIGCKQTDTIDKLEGSALLVAYGSISSNTPNETIASAVSIGIPTSEGQVGVIMEHAGVCSAAEAESVVREMAATAMSNHGIMCKEILSSSVEATVTGTDYVTVISSVAMW